MQLIHHQYHVQLQVHLIIVTLVVLQNSHVIVHDNGGELVARNLCNYTLTHLTIVLL